MSREVIPDLMWVTDRQRSSLPLAETAKLAVDGGVNLVHIREKTADRTELLALAVGIADVIVGKTPIVINSDAVVAKQLGLGLHIPESLELDIDTKDFPLVGRSVHSPTSSALSQRADYLVAGHVFETNSKAGRAPLGLTGLASIVAATDLPVLAIGGITPERVGEVVETGAHGVAVMSGIGATDHPGEAAARYRAALDSARRGQSGATIMTMPITVNGKSVELDTHVSIQEFLDSRKLHRNMVVVEHNGVILKKSQFADVILQSGDVLEVVHFVGGG